MTVYPASRLRVLVLGLVILSSACAPALLKLPESSGPPSAIAEDVIRSVYGECSPTAGLSAEAAIAGSVGGAKLRGRLLVGLTRNDVRIEAVAPFGQPVFIFASRGEEATLLLPRDNRALQRAQARAVFEALTGLPIDPSQLLILLTACPVMGTPGSHGVTATSAGKDWIVVHTDEDVYIHRPTATSPWRVAAVVFRNAWRAEYRGFENHLPAEVRLVSADAKQFDVRLRLSQVDVNPQLGDEAFRVQVPRSADPISIDELRRARPGVRQN